MKDEFKKAGPPKGSRNAAKPGDDLRLELFLSKPRRKLLEEYYLFKHHRLPDDEELRTLARYLANTAIDQECVRALTRQDRELLVEVHLAETTTTLFAEYFKLRFGRTASSQELQEQAQIIFEAALKQIMVQEFERHPTNSFMAGIGEVL